MVIVVEEHIPAASQQLKDSEPAFNCNCVKPNMALKSVMWTFQILQDNVADKTQVKNNLEAITPETYGKIKQIANLILFL